MSSQNSSVSGPLHSVPLPLAPPMALGAAPPPPAASPSQQLGPDAFAIVERAQQMVEILTEENRVLHQELQGYYDNADKLHKVGGLPRGPGGGRFSVLQVDRSHPGLAGPKAGVRGADQVGESKWTQSPVGRNSTR